MLMSHIVTLAFVFVVVFEHCVNLHHSMIIGNSIIYVFVIVVELGELVGGSLRQLNLQ